MITEGLLDTLLQGVNMKQQEDSSSLETIQRLVQENQRLTSENQRLAQENQRLHEQIGLLRKREWQHQQRLGVTSTLLERPVSDMRLSRRTEHLLMIRGFRSLGDIISAGRNALIEIPYMGIKSISEIDKYLTTIGLSWDTDVTTVLENDSNS